MRILTLSALVILSIAPSVRAETPALAEIIETARQNSTRGVKSLLIMDLDETVVDSHIRKYLAYRKATEELCGVPASSLGNPKSDDCERALGLSMHDLYRATNGYSSTELMTKLRIRDQNFIQELYKRRREYEGGSEFFSFDTLMPGASEFIRKFRKVGGDVYYVSSRGADYVADATYEQLIRFGLITANEKAFVILRKSGQSSIDFKRETARFLKEKTTRENTPVIGLFENEPENLIAWSAEFKSAKAVLIKGNLINSAPLPSSVIQTDSYR